MGGLFPIDEAYRLSETESARIFEEVILISEYGDLHEAAQPSVHFFGAQPGAGKTRPEALVIAHLTELDGPGAVMPIIGDDCRATPLRHASTSSRHLHPKIGFEQLLCPREHYARRRI